MNVQDINFRYSFNVNCLLYKRFGSNVEIDQKRSFYF